MITCDLAEGGVTVTFAVPDTTTNDTTETETLYDHFVKAVGQ